MVCFSFPYDAEACSISLIPSSTLLMSSVSITFTHVTQTPGPSTFARPGTLDAGFYREDHDSIACSHQVFPTPPTRLDVLFDVLRLGHPSAP